MSLLQKLLSRGSQTAPKIIDEVVESKALREAAQELGEEAPEVIGKGTRTVTKEASEDIPEAAFKEVTPTTGADDMSLWNRLDKKKAAALLGLGGAGALMLGGEETPAPTPIVPPSITKAIEPIKPEELKQEIKKTVKTEAPKKEGLAPDAQIKEAEVAQELPSVDEFDAAKDRADRNAMMAMLGKAASQIGGGIASLGAGSQVKIDDSGFDQLLKMSDRPLSHLTEKQKYTKAKSELDDEAAMRNPKSEISKLVSDIAIKTGLIKPGQQVSAMSLKNAGVNLGTLLSTIEAAKGRKEAAQLALQERRSQKEAMLDEKQRKFAQGLRKEATTGVLGKQYATYATGQRMSDSLSKFAEDPSGYKDYASLMGGLKALQGDESVVREAEVRMGVGATSAMNTALNYLERLRSGKTLQPEQRQQMIETIKILTDASRQQYLHSVQPILEQAEMEGVDPELILSGSLAGAKSKSEAPVDNNSKQKTVVKKQYSPSRDQTKLIFSDGSEEIVDGKQ